MAACGVLTSVERLHLYWQDCINVQRVQGNTSGKSIGITQAKRIKMFSEAVRRHFQGSSCAFREV
uniref:Uncharacterized protein n=1 Tax=Athene cunicularia TaxID=194338 RepID=A0A663ML64_ATHCN